MGCGSAKPGEVVDPTTGKPMPPPPKAEVIFILGGPGSGKGTQCEHIVKDYCFIHLSTGDLLRQERQKGGPDAEMIEGIMKEGKLVPSDLLVKLIKNEVIQNGNTGRYLLDGFPRSLDNWESWNKIIGNTIQVKFLLFFECTNEVMQQRLMKRGETSGRADDNAETIQKRLDTFQNETMPIVREFEAKKLIQKVSSVPPADVVHEEVQKVMTASHIVKVNRAPVIFVLGGPESGKEQQCQRIVRDSQFTRIQIGKLLEAEVNTNGQHSRLINEAITVHKPVPSDLLVQLIKRDLLKRQLKGQYLIDGFPKSQENLDSWNKLMTPFTDVKFLLNFQCSFSVMETKLLAIAKETKSADTPETITKRLEKYDAQTKPIIAIFQAKNQLLTINTEQSPDTAYCQLKKLFKAQNCYLRPDGTKPPKLKFVVFVQSGPGSGKSTQCAKLAKEFKFDHISVDEIIRGYMQKGGDEAGKVKQKYASLAQINQIVQKGMEQIKTVAGVLPGIALVKLIEKAINDSKNRKFVVDGFPRNLEDIQAWQKNVHAIKVKYLLCFEVSKDIMIERLTKRGEKSEHPDDKPEAITKRIDTYISETEPVVRPFDSEQRLLIIKGDADIDAVYKLVESSFVQRRLNR